MLETHARSKDLKFLTLLVPKLSKYICIYICSLVLFIWHETVNDKNTVMPTRLFTIEWSVYIYKYACIYVRNMYMNCVYIKSILFQDVSVHRSWLVEWSWTAENTLLLSLFDFFFSFNLSCTYLNNAWNLVLRALPRFSSCGSVVEHCVSSAKVVGLIPREHILIINV